MREEARTEIRRDGLGDGEWGDGMREGMGKWIRMWEELIHYKMEKGKMKGLRLQMSLYQFIGNQWKQLTYLEYDVMRGSRIGSNCCLMRIYLMDTKILLREKAMVHQSINSSTSETYLSPIIVHVT